MKSIQSFNIRNIYKYNPHTPTIIKIHVPDAIEFPPRSLLSFPILSLFNWFDCIFILEEYLEIFHTEDLRASLYVCV